MNYKVFLDNVYFTIFDASKYSKEEFEKIIQNEEEDLPLGIKDYEGLKLEIQEHKNVYDKYKKVSTDGDVEDSAEGFLKGSIVLMGTLFGAIALNMWINKKLSVLKFAGLLVAISAVSQASYRILDLMNNSVDDGTKNDSQKMANFQQKIDAIIATPNDDKLRAFSEEYHKFDSKGSYVDSAKYIDEFFKKQELFMLKNENIGVKNVKYYERLDAFYGVVAGKPSTNSWLVNHAIQGDEYKTVRGDLKKHFEKMEMSDTLATLLKHSEYEGDFTYKKLFEKDGVLEEHLIKLSEQFNLVYDVDVCMKYVVKINNLMTILQHAGLPEHNILKYELLFRGIPEFFELMEMDHRYTVTNETQSLEKLKENMNFKACGTETSHHSEYIDDICSRFNADTKDKLLATYRNIIRTVSEDNTKFYLDRIKAFTELSKKEVVVKKDMLSDKKYKDIVLMFGRVFNAIFKHSNVQKMDLIAYFKRKTKEEEQPTLFSNSKKMLDIMFDEMHQAEHNLVPIKENNLVKKQYIDFDHFRTKLDSYTDDDLRTLHKKVQTLEDEMDIVIRVKKTIKVDASVEKKMTIFRDGVYLYIASSMFFVLDYMKTQLLTGVSKPPPPQDGGKFGNLLKKAKGLKPKKGMKPKKGGPKADSKLSVSGDAKDMMKDMTSQLVEQQLTTAMDNVVGTAAPSSQMVPAPTSTEMTTPPDVYIANVETKGPQKKLAQAKMMLDKSKSAFYDTLNKANTLSQSTNVNFKSDQLINVSVVLAGWLLSIVMLFSYYMKMDSSMTYNMKVKYNNTIKLKGVVKTLNHAAEGLYKGKNKEESQHAYYEALKTVLSSHTKCNDLKMNEEAVPFPATEVLTSMIMIGICVSIIISQNLLNNPFEVLNKFKAMRANKLAGGAMQAGGDKEAHLIALERFNASLLDNKENFMTHVTVAFTIMFSVIFLCYRLLNNTLRYKSELFNGKLFAESICYT